MRFRTALSLATMFLVCFTVAAWSTPGADPRDSASLLPSPDNESITGKISSIGDAQFSLDVSRDKDLNTVQFLVDDQTRVEGKLTVGAQATVEYHTDSGKNIAVRVVVTKTSALAAY